MLKSLNKGLLILFGFSLSITVLAQESIFRSDIEQINAKLSQSQTDRVKHTYIYKNEPSKFKKFNPFGLLLGGTLYLYQNILSKHISADCLYTPSCSEFSKQAIKEEGLLRGVILSIDRVNRCNRIAGADLNHYNPDQNTGRFPDPVSRHRKVTRHNEE